MKSVVHKFAALVAYLLEVQIKTRHCINEWVETISRRQNKTFHINLSNESINAIIHMTPQSRSLQHV
ncbi:CLUMA_CG005899, isoform A [Clunio marinus]|uniref:CLUMA_CG005899, isoform A n=1 Tax=Clunio marinus TaxID=568069 RepID=A0A1J1HXQ1_9DIPT|nr:CLUMA_CG005899, isoform A [Clunio marinus]